MTRAVVPKEEIMMTRLGEMIYEDGRKAGIMLGRQQGLALGIEQGKIEVARELLDILSDDEIAQRTKLPLELVQRLRRESQR